MQSPAVGKRWPEPGKQWGSLSRKPLIVERARHDLTPRPFVRSQLPYPTYFNPVYAGDSLLFQF